MNKTIYKICAVALVGSLFTSCSLYKKYEQPKTIADSVSVVRDPIDGNKSMAETTDTTNFGDVAWKDLFKDPKLQTLIEKSFTGNTDLLNAAQNVKIAEAQLMTARLAYIPSFSFTPSGTLSKVVGGNSDYTGGTWSKMYDLPVNASWNVDLFGSLVAANRSAKVAMIASKDYQQAVRTMVICSIADCYFTLLLLDHQLEVQQKMEKLTKDTWEMMKLRSQMQAIKQTSVVSAEASYYSVLSGEIDTRRSIRETENSLCMLVGQPVQTIERGTLSDQGLPTKFAAGVNFKLLANRPDVHATEMTLAECFYGIESARARFYPGLNITAQGTFTNSLGSTVVNPGVLIASIVGSLTQPIFQNGKLIAGLRVAKAQYQQAFNNWENSLLVAGQEISNALVKYNSSVEKGQVDQKRIDALTKSVDYTRELFKMGSSTYLEVITAQQNLLNAELNLITDDYNKMNAVVSLYSALGGGRK